MENLFGFDERLLEAARRAEDTLEGAFREIDETARECCEKVLYAMQKNRVSAACLSGTTGYGYDDLGRDTLDKVYADVFHTQDALARHHFVSGTHALSAALFGVLRPGDTLLSVTGAPYDTLEEVIGLRRGSGSLKEFGVKYRQCDLRPDGKPDLEAIHSAAKGAKMAYIQRSRGYSLRAALTVGDIGEIVRAAKSANPDIIVLTDNCYGEFTDTKEPSDAGADLLAGSLIKNPGGGVARGGGYLAGRADLVEQCARSLFCPGTGRETGCSLDTLREMYLGLFLAPEITANARKTGAFAAALFGGFGVKCLPEKIPQNGDIITVLCLETPERVKAFCEGIQAGSPVDAFAVPEPWDMPGYDAQVIMAAGTFTAGASIELSADAPLREPYAVYLQGGLTYGAARAGVLRAAQTMLDKGLLRF